MYRGPYIGSHSHTYWLVLAEPMRRCYELGSHLQQVPKVAAIQQLPTTPLTPIVSPLPFATWGMDILGPFPKATRQCKFLFITVDYFIKWIEVEALASITATEV